MANPAKNKLAKPVILDKDARDTSAPSLRDYIDMMVKAVYKCIDGLRDYINKRFDGTDKRIDGTDKRIDNHEQNVGKHFDGVDKRFDGVDKRFDGVDKRFDRLERNVDKRFDGVDKRFDRAEDRALKIWLFSMSVVGAGFIYIITLLHQLLAK